jgi:hypothetical protein
MIPLKTPEGQQELTRRSHGLSQKHRTILLLVDGRRSLDEVMGLARHAGATPKHFEELLVLGLVLLPQVAISEVIDEVDIPLSTGLTQPPPPEDLAEELGDDPVQPASHTRTVAAGATNEAALLLESAREMLADLIRTAAPVAGALTLMKVRRAQGREELADLLYEVQSKVERSRTKPADVDRTLQRARELLFGSSLSGEDLPFDAPYAQQPA